VSDLNLVPTTLDEERTGAVDLGLGSLSMPFAKFRKSEFLCCHHASAADPAVEMLLNTGSCAAVDTRHPAPTHLLLPARLCLPPSFLHAKNRQGADGALRVLGCL
jgi:hypothetical protein